MPQERDPILNIQPADPFNPRPTIVTLRFDEPKQFEGKYGTQFMYSVSDEGGRTHTMFASQALDGQIHKLGAKKGDRLAIIRTGEGKDTRWTVRFADGRTPEVIPQDKRGASRSEPRSEPQPQAITTNIPRAKKSFDDRLASFLNDLHLYVSSYAAVMENLKHIDAPKSIDINAAAFVIYKMAKDHGIELDNDGNPVMESADDGLGEPLPF